MDFIPYGKQFLDQEDIDAVLHVLKSDYLTSGPEIEQFEMEFASMVGAKFAVAVSNATAALHLAMKVAGIGPGDRVLTSPNTFLASANAALYVGATPDFADIDPCTFNITAESLKNAWSHNVKAVVPVAYAGQSSEMPQIYELAKKNGAIVIEDVCHGPGGRFEYCRNKYKLGGHPFADLSVFSFHPVKTITTSEGGMLTTDNEEMARKAKLHRNHGMVRDNNSFTGALPDYGPWSYEMQELGFNYRMTDMQAALGRSQLRKLPAFIKRRQEIVEIYDNAFEDISYLNVNRLGNPNDKNLISWHLYSPRWDFELLGKSRSIVMQELKSVGVGTQVLYIPVYLQPYYQRSFGYAEGKCPIAERVYSQSLSLPLSPSLTQCDLERIIDHVCKLGS